MTHVIDRRPQATNKSVVNRERFIRRYKEKIKEAVSRSLRGRSITDMDKGGEVTVTGKDITEPYIGHGNGGVREQIHPGNKKYVEGDSFPRPRGGKGRGNTASDSDELSEDDFRFALSKEEFLQYFFEDLELPDLIKKQLSDIDAVKHHRAGYQTSGASTNLRILRSMRGALGRRIATGNKYKKRLAEIEEEIEALGGQDNWDVDVETNRKYAALYQEGGDLKAKIARVPFIDPMDLRYSTSIPTPAPMSKAVMFCVMDVSGSMGEEEKDKAKRFFMLLYLFLTRSYDKIELVFIRHHSVASEVTEEEFFYGKESGGTVVSTALNLTADILEQRYPPSEWNSYIAQASDGDNWGQDCAVCDKIIRERLLPLIQYFAYVEITPTETQILWDVYQKIAKQHKNFAVKQIKALADIYPVFCDLFRKQGEKSAS